MTGEMEEMKATKEEFPRAEIIDTHATATWDICELADRGCKRVKDREIFDQYCSGNYLFCPYR